MTKDKAHFMPALRFRRLTPLYDPVLRWMMREEAFKRRLIAQANLGGRRRVLDLGCGTGTLTILVKRAHPDADIVGLDPDPEVLERAATKAAEAGVDITWDRGFATRLPYPDRSFDRVLSSLVTHHLIRAERQAAFREVLRVLRPGGEFHLVDFGPPRTLPMRFVAALLRPLEQAGDHFDGLLPGQIEEAGFESVAETDRVDTALGPLVMVRAVKPARYGGVGAKHQPSPRGRVNRIRPSNHPPPARGRGVAHRLTTAAVSSSASAAPLVSPPGPAGESAPKPMAASPSERGPASTSR